MGFFSAESKSSSTADSSRQTLQAGDNSIVSLTRGGGKGSTTIGANATSNTFGKGAVVTIQQSDSGAIAAGRAAFDAAADNISKLVKSQADSTAAALGSLGKLGETRVTGGENLVLASSQSKLLYVVAGLAAVVLAFFYFRRA